MLWVVPLKVKGKTHSCPLAGPPLVTQAVVLGEDTVVLVVVMVVAGVDVVVWFLSLQHKGSG